MCEEVPRHRGGLCLGVDAAEFIMAILQKILHADRDGHIWFDLPAKIHVQADVTWNALVLSGEGEGVDVLKCINIVNGGVELEVGEHVQIAVDLKLIVRGGSLNGLDFVAGDEGIGERFGLGLSAS